MAGKIPYSARRSLTRRALILATVAGVVVGSGFLARRAGFISWDLQPILFALAQSSGAPDTNCAQRVSEEDAAGTSCDSTVVATTTLLRGTDGARRDYVISPKRLSNSNGKAPVMLSSDVQAIEPRAKSFTLADLTPQDTETNRDLLDEVNARASVLDPCATGRGCETKDPIPDPTPVGDPPVVEPGQHDVENDDGHDGYDGHDGRDSSDSSHDGESGDDHHGGGDDVAEDHHGSDGPGSEDHGRGGEHSGGEDHASNDDHGSSHEDSGHGDCNGDGRGDDHGGSGSGGGYSGHHGG